MAAGTGAHLTLEDELRFVQRVKGAPVLVMRHVVDPQGRDQVCAAVCEILQVSLVAVPAHEGGRVEQAGLALNGL